MLPMVFIMITMANVASDRIGAFLDIPELDQSSLEHNKDHRSKNRTKILTTDIFCTFGNIFL